MHFKRWAMNAGGPGVSLLDIIRLSVRTLAIDGEVFTLLETSPDRYGLRLIQPDTHRVPVWLNSGVGLRLGATQSTSPGRHIRLGVEFDDKRIRHNYYLTRYQPHEVFSSSVFITGSHNTNQKSYILQPANDTLHYFIPDLPNTPNCLLYTSPSPRDRQKSRMPSSA